MSDLISRDALIEQLKQYKSEWKLAEPFHEGIASGLKIAIEVTDKLPTVEANPLVYGEWIEDQVETGDPFGNGYYLIDMLRCSVCGAFFDVSETRNFCPECGADMRKKVE